MTPQIERLMEFSKNSPSQHRPDLPPFDFARFDMAKEIPKELKLEEPREFENGIIYYGEWSGGEKNGKGV